MKENANEENVKVGFTLGVGLGIGIVAAKVICNAMAYTHAWWIIGSLRK